MTYADQTSAMCAEGKHGRCSGWIVVPNHGKDRREMPDISVKCWCGECKHPDVDPRRHLTHPPKGSAWSSSTTIP